MKHDHHLELFTQWIQSPQVQVALGGEATERTYRLPIDLVRERSTVLAKSILDNGEKEVVQCKVPLTKSLATLNAFIAWFTAARPQLEEQDTLEDTVELGILADQLNVWALSNQVTDLIESQVKRGAWKWSAQTLNNIYEKVAAERPLRRLVQATLLTMDGDHSIFRSQEEQLEDMAMDQVFLTYAALGCDYHKAKRGQGARKNKWSGNKRPCEYHEHPWARACEADEIETNEEGCPYMTNDCYPVWKVQDVDYAGSGDDVEAVTPLKEEDCMFETGDEPEPCPDIEPEPPADVVDDGALTAEAEMPMDKDLSGIEEEERPPLTLDEIKAEILRMRGKSRKKLKTWMKKGEMEPTVEGQPDDWVHAFG